MVITCVFLLPHTPHGWVIHRRSFVSFLVGLVDDLLHIKPYQKLIGQMIGAADCRELWTVVAVDRSLPVNMAITIFWLIGITNAINLLDNMDGLATGIAAIASGFLTLSFVARGQRPKR